MTSATFRETLQAHVLPVGQRLRGDHQDGAGKVAALYPIEPWRVSVFRDRDALRYRIANPTKGTESVLRPDQILHFQGLSGDGVWGYSVIRKAREALGLGLATEKFGAAFFGQGASFGGILTHPARLSDPARENLRKSINDRHQGVERAHNFIILEEGLKYDRLGIPPEDAQFLETRKFQLNEVARMFGCPPHMIGDVERSTSWGTGIEQQGIGFVTYTMRRWFVRWEQELTRKLISPLEWQQQAIEFLVDGLLRGDTATRYQAYSIGRTGGWFSANDIREMESLNPLPARGRLYLVPANMLPADQVANPPEPAPAPAPAPAAAVEAAKAARALRPRGLEGNVRALLAREPIVMPDLAPILERRRGRGRPRAGEPRRPDLRRLERLEAAWTTRTALDEALRPELPTSAQDSGPPRTGGRSPVPHPRPI
jgi:HK97 family phage portal protein